uniref:Uncharacterized protein n=1 Tax=Arundo donax TaxID=35708 RepID=A0A0A8YPD4_ARUDO
MAFLILISTKTKHRRHGYTSCNPRTMSTI